ncbi:hypothetical protein [Tumebacillus permanentifrigoris]|uniref:PIN domain-containing protein n=1 Tax=Tumebacillus permanentifrigoris TaxID=378543 RepID=A0A316E0Y8_9BACL|nr:hypothetical protein [Tumebacillus permanentifrigoris]PWK16480.1 hypothetical protein C7459_101344 [Tumebacillus permanentifrigoris]
MKLHIVLDPAFIVDLFLPATDPERIQRITRIHRHILVGSRELRKVWDRLVEQPPFRDNAFLQEALGDWFTDILTSASKYHSVTVDEPSKVQGEVNAFEKILLDTAYASPSKIVVADMKYAVRAANPELTYVSKDAFSKPAPPSITMSQVRDVLKGESNLKKDLFAIFETPIHLQVSKSDDPDVLAQYFANFYDQKLVIQDKFFIGNEKNEANFKKYILPHLKPGCDIKIRAMIKQNDQAQRKKCSLTKQAYAKQKDFKIDIDSIEETREDLHDGYIESSAYRIDIPYRMFVFGEGGKTTANSINIRRK